ncbi:hypothetical protein GCM10010156_66580 [Planobispora rosea]|uniref:Uncharacterized protein n=1 Tax=Planobispora rosea TaxID=35762 RepID=A0A8J3WHN5_PLARO|nr:MAB_1171c family putative transporter [Planobispora rosea]GGS99113.1 hypothetical protein GCM10010156_66580 [Planobispora rosea]GIH88021.1 hypothetical protein Pro02_64290 [Planobispora rosea]
MSEGLHLITMTLMWMAVIWRAPAVRSPGAARALWVTLLAIAIAWSMSDPTVLGPLLERIDRLAGWPAVSLAKRCIAVAAAAGLAAFTLRLTGRPSWPLYAAAAAATAVMLSAHAAAGHDIGKIAEWDGSAAELTYFTVYEGFVVLSAAIAGLSALRHACSAHADPWYIRIGLGLFGASIAAWVPTGASVLITLWLEGPGAYVDGSTRLPMALTLLGMTAGSVIPAIGVLVRRRHRRQLLASLTPLHAAITAAFPGQAMALEPGADLDTRLMRTLIEIRDGLLMLARYMDQPLSGDVAAAATWVHTALDRHRDGHLAATGRGGTATLTVAHHADLAAELTWLAAVSSVYAAPAAAPSPPLRLARALSTLTNPKILGGGLPILAGAILGAGPGLEWGAAAALLCAGLPIAAFHAGGGTYKRGRARLAPLLLATATLIMGLAVLLVVHAPAYVIEVMITLLVMLVVLAPIMTRWDISWHSATAAVCVTWAVLRIGPAAGTAAILIVACAWARVRLGEHTPAQTIAGTALGTAVAAAILTLPL